MIELSIILPVFDERDNLKVLYEELIQTLEAIAKSYEVLFVDDGSTDGSHEVLAEIQALDEHVRVIELRRNFGQTAALAAGFDSAMGSIVITMDADGQNDPKDIPMLLSEIERGFDMVCGWRYLRKENFWHRRAPSLIANRLISWTTDIKLHDYGCTLRAMRQDVVKDLHLYGEMHRFIPAIASWAGVRLNEVKVNHRARRAGKSKYGLSRVFRVLLDLLTVKFLLSFSGRPIQFFGSVGLVSSGVGVVILLWLGFEKIMIGKDLADRPIVLLAILLVLAGMQFVTLGLLAEMQVRTYHESQKKPIYTIRKVLGDDSSPLSG
jgi:glycosyltransferase involved in cell wall biosynthesis